MPTEFTAKQIKTLRKRLKLSQESLARELRISAATVNRWENGHHRPGQMAVQLLERLQARAARRR